MSIQEIARQVIISIEHGALCHSIEIQQIEATGETRTTILCRYKLSSSNAVFSARADVTEETEHLLQEFTNKFLTEAVSKAITFIKQHGTPTVEYVGDLSFTPGPPPGN